MENKRNGRNRNMISPAKRPPPSRGTKEAPQNLKIAQRYTWLFISGFEPDTQSEDVLQYIRENGHDLKCICEKMKTKKSNQRSSFKLGVPKSIVGDINTGSFWPKGATINHFMNLQSRLKQATMPQQRPTAGTF